MRQIPVETSSAAVMVAQPPQPKVRDRRTGEVATDAETGAVLMTVDVMFVLDGNAEILSLTVPETGISGELAMGTPVALTGLIARPWENEFNGQKRHGIAFRAVAVTSLVDTAAKAKAA
ncbi:SCO3933 family regulatory protein [Streptomyces sp. NPDC004069]